MTKIAQAARRGGGPARMRSVVPTIALTTTAVIAREGIVPQQANGLQAVARLTAESEYGSAAWAARFSNGKYDGALPGEGALPALPLVAAAREGD
eukprot:1234548-Pleurochrysis_carterae.AAC.2